MKTINLLLSCPYCGCSEWIPCEDEDAELAFRCAKCGGTEFPENMDTISSDDSTNFDPSVNSLYMRGYNAGQNPE